MFATDSAPEKLLVSARIVGEAPLAFGLGVIDRPDAIAAIVGDDEQIADAAIETGCGAALFQRAANRKVDRFRNIVAAGAAGLPDLIGDVPQRRAAAHLGEGLDNLSGDVAVGVHIGSVAWAS